ncbi:PRTRC system ThiF family protein [Pseudomonas violetae]|uniref:PRTRC system ThiF family protein n=1 Tax=Pseudomonas violetae TaxID=2915813 RepID=A0ABT0ESF1_9PSED|nr:PRTRC system ThiF family protein [Pseudomonas violetae]MCK1788658.1 PRTRC system ThiF family protein [Pseudomonas violetae]
MSASVTNLQVPTRYVVPTHWTASAIRIVVLGAGGNGSEVVDCLSMLHCAIRSLGHPHGLAVTIIDDAVVRESNLVRQRFWPCDMGGFKSIVLANRYNLNLGLQWIGLPHRFPCEETTFALADADLIISCVDVNSARMAVADYKGKLKPTAMWLDMGNGHRHGQVVFGGLGKATRSRYPNVLDLYPEIAGMADNTTKSCSAAESIAAQDCLINRTVATAAMNILWELIRKGSTERNWITVSLESGEQMTQPFPCQNSES